jgi:hypothetical protein
MEDDVPIAAPLSDRVADPQPVPVDDAPRQPLSEKVDPPAVARVDAPPSVPTTVYAPTVFNTTANSPSVVPTAGSRRTEKPIPLRKRNPKQQRTANQRARRIKKVPPILPAAAAQPPEEVPDGLAPVSAVDAPPVVDAKEEIVATEATQPSEEVPHRTAVSPVDAPSSMPTTTEDAKYESDSTNESFNFDSSVSVTTPTDENHHLPPQTNDAWRNEMNCDLSSSSAEESPPPRMRTRATLRKRSEHVTNIVNTTPTKKRIVPADRLVLEQGSDGKLKFMRRHPVEALPAAKEDE